MSQPQGTKPVSDSKSGISQLLRWEELDPGTEIMIDPELVSPLFALKEALTEKVRPQVIYELQPIARLVAEYLALGEVESYRAFRALRESAYCATTRLTREISRDCGLDQKIAREALEMMAPLILKNAARIAFGLLGEAAAQMNDPDPN